MNEEDTLLKAIRKARKSMQGYRSLPEYLLDGVGAILTFWRRPHEKRMPLLPADVSKAEDAGLLPYWLSGLIVAALIFLIGWLTSIALDQPMTIPDIQVSGWTALIGALALIANKINIRTFLETFNDSILDKILLPGDVEDLENFLNKCFNIFWPLIVGFVAGPGLAWILLSNLIINFPNSFNTGTIVVVNLTCILAIWVAYYLFPFYVVLPARLVRYHFDLYKTDPSSSEVLGRLSRLMTFIMYVTLIYIVVLTIYLNRIQVLNLNTAIVFSLLVWAPTIVLYVASQYHISNLIMREKWHTLNEIQAKVESLYADAMKTENVAIKSDMLEIIEKMMDSHDRIKSTPNSVLNIRSSLTFMNSLLLPILAFIVANLNEVMNFIKGELGK